MSKQTYVLSHQQARQRAIGSIVTAPDGWRVVVGPPVKSRDQEEKYHAQIGDIAAQSTYAGQKWGRDDMKRILIDEFAEAMRQAGTPLHNDGAARLIPSEDGRRVIQLGIQSRDFWVSEGANFIEFLFAWGADRGVVWSDHE